LTKEDLLVPKKDPKRWCRSWVVTTCLITVLAVLLIVGSTVMAAGKPKTVAEIALYQGPDREKVLIEGAKKEGKLIFYNTNTWMTNVVSKEFEKKYPFIKVLAWRSGGRMLIRKVIEEYTAGRIHVDVMESSAGQIVILHKKGVFQEYYTPEAVHYSDKVKLKGKSGGFYYVADRELYWGLGFNTKLISPAEAPKTRKDLLDPRWKGKMSIPGTTTGVKWVGNTLEVMGRDFLDKLSRQDIKVQNISGAALNTLIVAGEVPLSPAAGNTTLALAKQRGAPVEWRPMEPVVTNLGFSGVTTGAPHPHAALLFLDYLHSKEGQKVVMQGNLVSPRQDIGSLEQEFKKDYLDVKYPVDVYEKKFNEWENLMRQLFIRKR
jgi:iron(III) transport system substrate-binding protein